MKVAGLITESELRHYQGLVRIEVEAVPAVPSLTGPCDRDAFRS